MSPVKNLRIDRGNGPISLTLLETRDFGAQGRRRKAHCDRDQENFSKIEGIAVGRAHSTLAIAVEAAGACAEASPTAVRHRPTATPALEGHADASTWPMTATMDVQCDTVLMLARATAPLRYYRPQRQASSSSSSVNGSTRTRASSRHVPTSDQRLPSRLNASSVRAMGSTSHTWETRSRA